MMSARYMIAPPSLSMRNALRQRSVIGESAGCAPERMACPQDGPPPLPWGEDGDEGVPSHIVAMPHSPHKPYPLTLSLSPWERGPEAKAGTASRVQLCEVAT